MLSTTLYAKFPSKPPIQPFKKPAPDIVGVDGARAEVTGYVDVPLQLAGVGGAPLARCHGPVVPDHRGHRYSASAFGDNVSWRLSSVSIERSSLRSVSRAAN